MQQAVAGDKAVVHQASTKAIIGTAATFMTPMVGGIWAVTRFVVGDLRQSLTGLSMET